MGRHKLQRTQLHFIVSNLNAQKYHDEIPFILKYLCPDAYLSSQSCEIHRLGPNEFTVLKLTDFLI